MKVFGIADSIYLDEHKDATLVMDNVDRKFYHQIVFVVQDVVGELVEFYLI